MKAVNLAADSNSDKLEMRDLPDPTVGPNDVKVRVAGNPIDWKLRSGAMKAMMPLGCCP
jgi:NADPH:quinone reductase-like Zn-dependent oxidoreductase